MKFGKYMTEAREITMSGKDTLDILQALWKAETFMNQVMKGNADILDVKHWLSVIKKAEKILNKKVKEMK